MSNTGVSFDTSLIQGPSEANASLNGIPLRLNPKKVSLPYTAKMSQTQTLGGMVVQVYGVVFGDLTVEGQFGAGGWQEQLGFLKQIQSNVQGTIAAQFTQVTPGTVGPTPSGSYRFLFPLLGYDLNVFLKSYSSAEGSAIELENSNINPTWNLTFTIDNDNSDLTRVAIDNYIARIQEGLGFSGTGAALTEFQSFNGSASPFFKNANVTAELASYLQSTGQDVSRIFTALGLSVPSASTASSSSSTGTGPPVAGGSAAIAADVNLTILGPNTATAAQLTNFWGNRGQPTKLQAPIAQVRQYYLDEGAAQGVRGDVAFAQACHETGYFTNNDTLQNNFAGVGHPVSAASGIPFSTPQIGVRAQIQLLYQVVQGDQAPLANASVSPGWGGKTVSTWAGLSGNWAADTSYANEIMTIYATILSQAGG